MRLHALVAGAAMFLGACAAQPPDPVTVSEVNVTADMSSIGNRNAVRYWQNLGTDLEAAMAAEFVGHVDPAGRIVNVDIDELSLSNIMTADRVSEDARLAGQVEVVGADGTSTYNVSATTRDVATFLPTDANITTIPPTSQQFYGAVVRAFARGAAEVVLGVPDA